LSREMAGQIERGNVQQADLPGGFTVLQIPTPNTPGRQFRMIGEAENIPRLPVFDGNDQSNT